MNKKYSIVSLAALAVIALCGFVLLLPVFRPALVEFLLGAPTRLAEAVAGFEFSSGEFADRSVQWFGEPLSVEEFWRQALSGLEFKFALFLIFALSLYIEWFVLPFKRHSDRVTAAFLTVVIYFAVFPTHMAPHDAILHAGRIEDIAQAIRAGDIPTHFNFQGVSKAGNAMSISYPELFLYVPALLRLTGMPLLLVYKLLLIMINSAAVLVGFYSMRMITKSRYIALIFSALYGLCIFRLSVLSLACAVGQALGMAFVPLAIAGIHRILYGDRKWLTLTIAMTCIIQSHVITTFITCLFIALFLLVNIKKLGKDALDSIGKAAVVCALLNMWFLVPFLTYYKYIEHLPPYSIYYSAVFPRQMVAPIVADRGGELQTRDTIEGELPLSLGITTLLGLIAFFIVRKDALFQRKAGFAGTRSFGTQALCYGLFALFLSSTLFPWEEPPARSLWIPFNFFDKMQFAWRFYIAAAPLLCMAASAGFYFYYITKTGGGGGRRASLR
jgi:hypothetical protein